MKTVKVYNLSESMYDNLKYSLITKIKEDRNDFVVLLPNGKLIDRLRQDITEELGVTLDLKLFTFDDLINYKNASFSEIENFDYYSSLIMNYSVNKCIKKGVVEDNTFYNSDGFLPLVSKLINYIKNSLIDTEVFSKEVKENTSLFSIGEIYKEYTKNLKKYKFEDRYDKYFKFIETKFSFDIENNIKNVFIAGFLDFRKIEYEIIKVLLDLNINIQMYYYNSLNEESEIYIDTLTKFENLSFEIKKITEIFNNSDKKVEFVECEDKYLEVKRAAIEIKKELFVNPNKKIAIIINDKSYTELISERFRFENIPINLNSKKNLKDTKFGKSMLNLLEESVALDKYIIRNLKNPLIFEEMVQEIELEKLILSLNIKNKEELLESNLLKSNSKYKEYKEILEKLFKEVRCLDTKESTIKFIKEKIENYILKEDEDIIIYQKFYTFIEGFEYKLRDIYEELEVKDFKKYIREIIKEFEVNDRLIVDYNISLIEFNTYKLLNYNSLYFLGFSENNFPKKEISNFYFNNKNINTLKKIGLDILSNKLKSSKDELNFNNIINSNCQQIYISYENSSNEIVSDFASKLIKDIESKEIYRFKNLINPNIEEVINKKDKAIYLSSYKKIKEKKLNIPASEKTLDIKEKYNSFSTSSLETYLLCPIKYYYKYVIELSDNLIQNKIEELALIGTACHDTLEKVYRFYYDEIKNIENISKILKDILKLQFKELDFNVEDFKGKNTVNRYSYLLENLIKNDLNYMNSQENLLKPYKFEEKISINKLFNINEKQENIQITGRIDRIDIDKAGNIHLVDYKLGKKSFKTINDFTKEKTLQFPIYSLTDKVNSCRYITIKDYKVHEFYKLDSKKSTKYSLTSDELSSLRYDTIKIIERLVSGIRNKDYFKGTKDYNNCTFCEYKNICDYRSK